MIGNDGYSLKTIIHCYIYFIYCLGRLTTVSHNPIAIAAVSNSSPHFEYEIVFV